MEGLAELLKGRSPVVPKRTALLVVDLQNDFVRPTRGMQKCCDLPEGFEEQTLDVIKACASRHVTLIWINSGFESDRPWRMRDGIEKGGTDAVLVDLEQKAPTEPINESVAQGNDEEEEDDDEDDLDALRAKLNASRSAWQRGSSNQSPATTPMADSPAPKSGLAVPRSDAQYRTIRDGGTLPRELFLSRRPGAEGFCTRGSNGAELIDRANTLFPKDSRLDLFKTGYSAFNTDLLMHLRSALITELYICGPTLNTSIFATAADAARFAFEVKIVEGCTGLTNHDAVISTLDEIYGVGTISADEILTMYGGRQLLPRTVVPTSSEPSMGSSESFGRLARQASERKPRRDLYGTSSVTDRPQRSEQEPRVLSLPIRPKEAVRPLQPGQITSTEGNGLTPSFMTPSQKIQAKPENKAVSHPDQAVKVDVPSQTAPPRSSPKVANGAPTDATTTPEPSRKKVKAPQHPVLGPGDEIGEGGSYVLYDSLNNFNSDPQIFSRLKSEVLWQKMYHATGEVPRLVCAQGIIASDGAVPIYRHPADESLPLLHFSPIVNAIRRRTEEVVQHPLNHCLVQLYRSGHDFISEHSDKSLDIAHGSNIVNVSFGATRMMRLRTKRAATADGSRRTQLVPLPHCSIFVLDSASNTRWVHSIHPDKRPLVERSPAELAYGGERISLTFRHIATFLDASNTLIWGQGATSKRAAAPRPVINADPAATQAMVNAFGTENQASEFDWASVYGAGFDVLHFTAHPDPPAPLLFLAGDHTSDLRIRIALSELNVVHKLAGVPRGDLLAPIRAVPAGKGAVKVDPVEQLHREVCFRDSDARRTQVWGDVPILLYVAERYKRARSSPGTMAEGLRVLTDRRYLPIDGGEEDALRKLEVLLEDREFVAGPEFTSADIYVWPVVDEWFEEERVTDERWARVRDWHRRVGARESVRRVLWADAEE